MDHNGIYCSASTTLNSPGPISATVRLPIPIDLSANEYELGLVYTSVIPTWLNVPDLWFIHTKTTEYEDESQDFQRLTKIPHSDRNEVLNALSMQLLEEYGNNMKEARLKIYKEGNYWFLRLQPKSELELSPGLSLILGIPRSISNDTAKVKNFDIIYRTYETFMENRVYYISCDQCKQNFVNSSGHPGTLLDFLHIPKANKGTVIEHIPSHINYVRLEGSLLNSISFSLYNHASNPMSANSVDLYLLFHIRKIRDVSK